MLRLLALLLPLLPPPAEPRAVRAEPSEQDMSLGVVSAGSAGSWDFRGLGEESRCLTPRSGWGLIQMFKE